MSSIIIVDIVITLLLLISGMILYVFPPKQVNSILGYRTKRSMKNQESWDCANKFAGKIMMFFGVIYFVVVGVLYLVFLKKGFLQTNENTIIIICVLLFVISFITTIVLVERKLKKVFK